MEEQNIQCFSAEKSLMETFLSQASTSEVFPNDVLFIHRNFNDSENYENKQCSTSSYLHDEKDYRCSDNDDAYGRDNGQFFFTFVSERDQQRNKLPQNFDTCAEEFDDVNTGTLSDVQFVNRKIDQPLLKLQIGEETQHLDYDESNDHKLETRFLSNVSVSKSAAEEQSCSSCPVLVQEASYSKESKDVSKGLVHPSCPILIQEPSFLQVGQSASDAEQVRPRTSKSFRKWNGENPLRRFSVLVGNKKLNFRVCDRRCNYQGASSLNSGGYAFNDGVVFKGNKCFVCGRTFPTGVALKEHQMSHTGAKPKPCSFCGRVFYSKNSLHFHERIHTGEKPFQCPICTKCFARQTNYSIHMKLHASGRRYFCSFCGKWFRSESDMLDHQRQCLARMQGAPVCTERPLRYQCSYCEKMFHHRRDKTIHERTHTGERPYSCGYCGKGFTQSQALTIHIRTHTGERPYTCLVCSKDFRDSSALRKHEFIKHTTVRLPNTSLSTVSDLVIMPVSTLMDAEGTEQLTST